MIESTTLVQVRFVVDKGGPQEYSDALYFTPEEFAALTPKQLETAQLERADSWRTSLAAASIASKDVTEEKLLASIAQLEDQRAMVNEQIAQKTTELAVFTAKVK